MERTKRVGALGEELEQEAKTLVCDFAPFTDGVRYITLLHRSKEGGDQNSEYKRRGGYFITHSKEEYLDALVRLLALKAISKKPYRLYASVNARNIVKAERAFKRDMLEVDFEDGENKKWFWQRLPSKWVSALMQPGARAQSMFMIDCDGEGDVTAPALKWLAARLIQPIMQYRTPNGWHIVTPPFNPTEWDVPNCEIKKDGLLLLAA